MTDTDISDDTQMLQLCADDPQLEAIHQLLLRVDADADTRGFGHPLNEDRLFEVLRNPSDADADMRWDDVVQALFDAKYYKCEGHVGRALYDLATTMEHAARNVTSDHPGADLYIPRGMDGYQIYGWAMLTETMVVVCADTAPTTVPVRSIQLAGRDGILWRLHHERGTGPVVAALLPEARGVNSGVVAHSLTRLTNAVVGNPVHVRGRGDERTGRPS